MEKIDRLGWEAGVVAEAYGARFGVRVSDRDLLRAVLERFPPGWTRADGPVVDHLWSLVAGGDGAGRIRRYHLLYANALRLARTLDLVELLDTLESHIALTVAEAARRRVFVHAGVVAWRGRAVLIPGASQAGKSTLVAALVRAGASYYSDEYAVLDERGRVHPYARPLRLRDGAGRTHKLGLESLGTGGRPLPVGLVAVPRYKPGARWRPRRLSPGRGLLELLAHAVAGRRRPKGVLHSLRQVVVGCPVVKSLRGEADATAPALLRLAEQDRGPREDRE